MTYNGDSHNNSAQTTVSEQVGKANTATSTKYAPGVSGTFTVVATVAINEPAVTPIAFAIPGGNGASTSPTGSVQFLNGGNPMGTVTLSSSGHLESTATLTLNATPASTTSITAVYTGDTNYNGSTSGTATGPPGGVVTIGVAASANPSTFAQPVTFTVLVASQTKGGPTPTGSVTASVLGSDALGSAGLNSNGTATITVPPQDTPVASPFQAWGLATGTNTITVAYSGDGNYQAGKTTFQQMVNQAASSTKLLFPPTAFGIYELQASVSIDEPSVSKTNFAIPAGGNLGTNPSGSVIFYSGANQVGTATLKPGGLFQATATLTTNGAVDSPRAVYAGDTNYATSNTGSSTLGGAPVNISLQTSASQVIYGGPFTVSATVTPVSTSGPSPTGSLVFYDNGRNLGWISTLNSSGKGSLPVPIPLATPQVCAPACMSAEVEVLTAGSHTITVSYSGDSNYAASTPTTSVMETIGKAPTTTTTGGISSTLLPGIPGDVVALVADSQPPSGGPYHFMVMGASGLGDGNPSGSVQFDSGGNQIGTANLTSNPSANVASDAEIGNSNASGSLSAAYGGDGNFQSSTSSVTASVSLTSNINPSNVGQSVTLTATVTPSSSTGTVQFLDGVTVLGTASLNGGVASINYTFNTAGTHR